jgi:outer membrane lipoprotein-sorting protein
MRICVILTLMLVALAPWPAAAQENEAEKIFRDLEKKIKAANAVQVTVEIEIRAIKGREDQSKLKDNVSTANAFLLFTKDNKARLRMSGEYFGMELVSNGKQLKLAIDEGDVPSINEAKAMPTPKHLNVLLSTLESRVGVTVCSAFIIIAPGPRFDSVFLALANAETKELDINLLKWGVGNFKAGPAEKVGGRDAKVVSYLWAKASRVTLWLDAATLLPLKRDIVLEEWNMHITVIYTEFKLNPKLDAKAFDLIPAQGNEAEKFFRVMEEKIKAAKAVEVTFDIEMKGKGKGEEGKLKGSVLFTKDNKARLKMSGNEMGKETTIEMISDGKRMKMADSSETIAKAEEEPTRAKLHGLLSAIVSGPGLTAYDLLQVQNAPKFRLVNFRTGPTEKVGGRDAKVVTYKVILMGGASQVTLWIDAETMLPVKRLMVAEGDDGKSCRFTETCNFNLDPRIDARLFVLRK